MSFTGKATYTAGSALPESAEDVSDLVSIASPFETPLLDALGDAPRPTRSTVHEWMEDALLPNTDTVNDTVYGNATTDTAFTVAHGSRFRAGDSIRISTGEVMLVTGVATNDLTVVRGYGGSTAAALSNGLVITILGNAALEGDDAAAARFTSRNRVANYTQIFSATAEVSGSEEAVSQIGIGSELTFQANNRLRELLRDLESTVIGGRAAASSPEGNASTRRTMKGLLQFITTNRLSPGVGGFPSDSALSEEQLNLALRQLWTGSNARVDLIVVGGQEKRSMNNFISASRRFDQMATGFRQLISSYESDFGICRVILSRAVPAGTVLLLDSTRIGVLPLAGRSFQFKRLAQVGDRSTGQVLGEYTLELRNESAHGVISGFTH